MALVTLDFQEKVDILNKRELEDALREDARLRSVIAGVKSEEAFFNATATAVGGVAVGYFSTPVNMVSGGLMWSIMSIGLELSANAAFAVYKSIPPGATPSRNTGGGRVADFQGANGTTPAAKYSKGQLPLRAGEQLTIIPASGTVQSVFIVGISIPAERWAELLI